MAYARSTTVSGVAKSLTARRGLCNSRNRSSFSPGRAAPSSEYVMPSHLFADRPAAQPPERGTVDALITQTRRLRGDVDAVRRDRRGLGRARTRSCAGSARCAISPSTTSTTSAAHLGQLREGPPAESADAPAPEADAARGRAGARAARRGSLLSRVGSAEWNLLTDEVSWSDELFADLRPRPGRRTAHPRRAAVPGPRRGPGTRLTAMVTDCLVDGRPIDGEFRIVRPDGERAHGAHDGRAGARRRRQHRLACGPCCGTSANCAAASGRCARPVTRCSASGTSRRPSTGSRSSCRRPCCRRGAAPCGSRSGGPGALDLAGALSAVRRPAHLIGGDWYDALQLPDGSTLLSVGDLTGHGVTATSGMAMLLGALRGMAVAGHRAGPADGLPQPAAGHRRPARAGQRGVLPLSTRRPARWRGRRPDTPPRCCSATGRGARWTPPDGRAARRDLGCRLRSRPRRPCEPGDLLVLHTDGLVPRRTRRAARRPMRAPSGSSPWRRGSPRRAARRTAYGSSSRSSASTEREDDACVLVARVGA